MKMTRASRIQAGLDRAEAERTAGAREELSEAGEVRVCGGIAARARRICVRAIVVRLPELNEGVPDRIAVAVEHAAGDVRNGSACRGEVVVEVEQVVVFAERKVVGQRIERPLGLLRSERESFGKRTGQREASGCGSHAFEKAPAVYR
jgi:hypothetical protein